MTDYKKMRITPKVARGFLDNNYDKNRRVNKQSVSSITSDMLGGRFIADNGQTITITTDGRLVDGQHRLSALVNSGKSFDFLVCIIEPDKVDSVFSTIDVGKPRSLSQFIGGKSRTGTAALTKIDHAIRTGTATLSMTLDGYVDSSRTRASTPTLAEWHEENGNNLEQIYNKATRASINTRCGSSTAIGAGILLLQYLGLDQHVDEFIEDLCSLTPSKTVSGAFIRKVARVRAASLTRGSALREELFLCFLAAYDGWCDGGKANSISKLDKTRAKYDNLLQIQREIDRCPTVAFAG